MTSAPPQVVEEDSDEDYESDYDDVWDDYYEYDTVTKKPKDSYNSTKQITKKTPKKNVEDKHSFLEDLPPDIYCDLVTTLDKR